MAQNTCNDFLLFYSYQPAGLKPSKMQIITTSDLLPWTEIKAVKHRDQGYTGTPLNLWFLWLPQAGANGSHFYLAIKLSRNK